jgi:hypothetical protein
MAQSPYTTKLNQAYSSVQLLEDTLRSIKDTNSSKYKSILALLTQANKDYASAQAQQNAWTKSQTTATNTSKADDLQKELDIANAKGDKTTVASLSDQIVKLGGTPKDASGKPMVITTAPAAGTVASGQLTIPPFAKVVGKNVVGVDGTIMGTVNPDGKTYAPSATLTSGGTGKTTTTVVPKVSGPSGPTASSKVSGTSGSTAGITPPAGTPSFSGTGPFNANDPAWKAFTDEYGVPAAFVNSDSTGELQNLFITAMEKHYSIPEFTAKFIQTKFAQTHTSQWQSAEKDRIESPASYAKSFNDVSDYLTTLQSQMGYYVDPKLMGPKYDMTNPASNHLDPSQAREYDPNNLVEWTLHNYYGQNLSSPDVQNAIRNHIVQLSKGNPNQLPGGDKASNINTLKSMANDYGLNSLVLAGGNDYFSNAADSIETGASTLDTWKTDMMNQAAGNYKAFANQIKAGITVRALAAPYINSLANLLEVPTDGLDLSASTGYGKMISDALRGNEDPNNPQPMTLADFQKQVKNDPRWLQTQNAQDSVMGMGTQLLRNFGLVTP